MKILNLLIVLFLSLTSSSDTVKVINAGIAGNTSHDLCLRLNDDVISKKPDLVLIMVGTNDMLNSGKFVSYKEYTQNLSTILSELKSQQIKAVLISPPPVDTVYLFERHPRNLFSESPNQKLDSIRSIMHDLAMSFNTGFVDLNSSFKAKGIPSHNTDPYIRNSQNCGIKDGVHPTAKGYQMIADEIFEYLVNKNLLFPNIKIICFGDSITKGIQMKGEGSSTGDTYPAFLMSRIKNDLR